MISTFTPGQKVSYVSLSGTGIDRVSKTVTVEVVSTSFRRNGYEVTTVVGDDRTRPYSIPAGALKLA